MYMHSWPARHDNHNLIILVIVDHYHTEHVCILTTITNILILLPITIYYYSHHIIIYAHHNIIMTCTCSSAATIYMARTGSTAPFIVMETDILSNGMPSKRICQPLENIHHSQADYSWGYTTLQYDTAAIYMYMCVYYTLSCAWTLHNYTNF